jgi:hypothetical protein
MEISCNGSKQDDPGTNASPEKRKSMHCADAPASDTIIVIDNRRLLLACAFLILTCGFFFAIGFYRGRRSHTNDNVPSSGTPHSRDKSAPDEFLEPECNIPFDLRTVSDPGSDHDDVQPTAGQMAQIYRLLPKETRIHDTLRIDAVPSLAFVLHQPQPHTSRATELTMFRFKKEGVDSENLGSFCFIPEFLLPPDGRAIGAWSENPTGGNAWSCSSLRTILIEKGEISYPDIESETWQAAKDLILDEDVPALIVLDTRFEFFEGLCHACSPIKRTIFELNRHGSWVDATSRHRRLVEKWIQEDIESLQEAVADKDEGEIGRAAMNIYLDAESAGSASRYRGTVKRALREIGWLHFIDLIEAANRRKCRIADVVEKRIDSGIDIRRLQ